MSQYRKYSNKITVVDGIKFRSKREAKRYSELKLLERTGAIRDLQRQVKYELAINGQKICDYIADFVYRTNHQQIVEDSKGFRTYEYKLKAKLMKAIHGIDILET
jgi:uridine kinase